MPPGEQVLLGPQDVGSAIGAEAWLGLCSAVYKRLIDHRLFSSVSVTYHFLTLFEGTESVSFFLFQVPVRIINKNFGRVSKFMTTPPSLSV